MDNYSVAELLSIDGYISVNKRLIKEIGLEEAVLIGELCSEYCYWKNNNGLEEDGSFYSTQDNIEANTGLNDYFQRKAFKSLKDRNILTVTKKGMPAKNYFLLNFSQLFSLLTTSPLEIKEQVVQPLNINNNIINKNNNKNKYSDLPAESEFNFGKPKESKPNLYQQCKSLIYSWTDIQELRELLIQYLDLCMEMKCIRGANQWKGMLNTLEKVQMECHPCSYESIIQQSIDHGWKTFYPISTNRKFTWDMPLPYKENFEDTRDKDAPYEDAMDADGNPIVF